jgi:hypothetical protein
MPDTGGTSMRKIWIVGLAAVLALALAGCGGGDNPRDIFTARITSDQSSDGDIAFDPVRNSYTVTRGPNTLYFGIDDADPNFPEYRAFLDFPLDGSTGGGVVPLNATIASATLKVSVVSVAFANTIPTRLQLVDFPVNGLNSSNYDSLPLTFPNGDSAYFNFNFYGTDSGIDVAIPVTSLMREVQRRGLADFKVRFLLDFVPNPFGFVGIDDHPAVLVTAPKLIVEYY